MRLCDRDKLDQGVKKDQEISYFITRIKYRRLQRETENLPKLDVEPVPICSVRREVGNRVTDSFRRCSD
jgi:hypothetical protein